MSNRQRIFALLGSAMIAGSGAQAGPAGAAHDVAAVNRVVDTVAEGFAKRDPDMVMSVFSKAPGEPLVFDFAPPAMDVGWDRSYAKTKAFFAGLDGPATIKWLDRGVTVDHDLAVVTAKLTFDGRAKGGKAIHLVGRSTLVLRRTAGRWLIIHEHDSVPMGVGGSGNGEGGH